MNTKDIEHLAHLSRLQLTETEVEAYAHQFDEIVGYVDKVKEFSNNETDLSDSPVPEQVQDDAPANVLREDIVSSYENPEQIINEAPAHQDNFVEVKKILNQ